MWSGGSKSRVVDLVCLSWCSETYVSIEAIYPEAFPVIFLYTMRQVWFSKIHQRRKLKLWKSREKTNYSHMTYLNDHQYQWQLFALQVSSENRYIMKSPGCTTFMNRSQTSNDIIRYWIWYHSREFWFMWDFLRHTGISGLANFFIWNYIGNGYVFSKYLDNYCRYQYCANDTLFRNISSILQYIFQDILPKKMSPFARQPTLPILI